MCQVRHIYIISGHSTCLSHTLVNWEWFSEWENERVKKRGKNYEDFKNSIGDMMWAMIIKMYPQLKDKVSTRLFKKKILKHFRKTCITND